MSSRPDDPAPELARVVDAISDGAAVDWEADRVRDEADEETLAALRLIERVARVHRGPGAPELESVGPDPAPEAAWGNLRLIECLGAGTYGEVYRAFDPGLKREVALKLWRETRQPRVIERLLGEARALARVRHPNVLVVHGADVHVGRAGMWTEMLEGATLEDLLASQGPCHWREAAILGIELCRAIAAVHAIGLVHCDVKTSNVMRERGGRIVLMDFGSVSDVRVQDDGPGAGMNGTPFAMAPEVLAGEPATPACDLYSLGVLLFRLVAGCYPVEAESIEQLREALASGPPPSLRAHRPEVPLAFSGVVERALQRSPAARPGSAGEMEHLLAESLRLDWIGAGGAGTGPARLRRGGGARAAVVVAVSAVVVAVAVLAGVWWRGRGAGTIPARPTQFSVQVPWGQHVSHYANVVVSPDGRSIAFAAEDSSGRSAVWIRRFDSLESARVPGTEGARYPFWSPDSRDIAFFAGGRLKRVGVDGGPARVICPAELGRGGTWGRDGTILFAGSTQGPLRRVPAEGGSPMPATVLDSTVSEVSHRWPCFLPDGEHFVYVSTPSRSGAYSLYAGSLHSTRRAFVGPVESGASYSSGVLVYLANQTLETRPFNLRTLRWSGDPVPISDTRGLGGSLAEPHASVSRDGILVYPSFVARASRLEWVDTRSGDVRLLATGQYYYPNLSPDGRHVAIERAEGTARSNVWILDAATGTAERWTDESGLNRAPAWSPAGDSIVYSSNRTGRYALYVRRASGPLEDRRLDGPTGALLMWPNDWHAGGLMTLDVYEPGTGYNVYELRDGAPVPVAATAADEMRGTISPDTRWLAFDSDASGQPQVYVIDRATSERFRISHDGGMRARWARSCGHLFYHTPAGDFFEVRPVAGMHPDQWPSRRLLRAGVLEGYDVDADGRRLLCCLRTDGGRPEEITVLANLSQAITRGL